MIAPTLQTTGLPDRRPKLILYATALRDMEAGLPVSTALAAALRMELAAFFIVDDASIEASRLPFTTHIGFSGGELAIEPGRLEEMIQREAKRCRQALSEAGKRTGLPWSFERLHGDALESLPAVAAGDILVVGLDGFGSPARHRIMNVREYAPARGGILFVPVGRSRRGGPVVTIGLSSVGASAIADVVARLAAELDVEVGHADLVADVANNNSVALLRSSRLLVAPLESGLFDNGEDFSRFVISLGVPLLVLRTAPVSSADE